MPKFAILNPKFTYTLPKRQIAAGIYDIFNHICEQYFSGEDDNISDYISEALMKSLIAQGKVTDWMVHMLGQSVGAYTDATHGMTLSVVFMAYY